MATEISYKHESLQMAILKKTNQTKNQTQNKALLLRHNIRIFYKILYNFLVGNAAI